MFGKPTVKREYVQGVRTLPVGYYDDHVASMQSPGDFPTMAWDISPPMAPQMSRHNFRDVSFDYSEDSDSDHNSSYEEDTESEEAAFQAFLLGPPIPVPTTTRASPDNSEDDDDDDDDDAYGSVDNDDSDDAVSLTFFSSVLAFHRAI